MSTRFRALQHRNFQLFIAGQLISLIGTWMQTTAQLWLVYKLTGSAALLGVFGFASQVPMLFLSSETGFVLGSSGRSVIVEDFRVQVQIKPVAATEVGRLAL